MGSADGRQGDMEVTHFVPDPNYGGAMDPDCQKPFPPWSWVKNTPKNSNNNQMAYSTCEGYCRTTVGHRSDLLCPPFHFGRSHIWSTLDSGNTLWRTKTIKKQPNNNLLVGEYVRKQQEDAQGNINRKDQYNRCQLQELLLIGICN